MAGIGEGAEAEVVSDSDSEGDIFELISPSLIQELRNVLDEYPDDGQIFKELIQNAEDAGAKTVQILTDARCFNRELKSSDLRKHPHLKFFQAPALRVYNDALFTDRDWEGIRMLHTSIKEKDPLKVGRFGLGFKSVFHLTDRLVILSGRYLMYMDPFRGKDCYCHRKPVAGLKGRELETVAGAFGLDPGTFTGKQGFSGTLFWFPLRQESSQLSSTVYSACKVRDLFLAFKTEAPSLLLFLNNIQDVSISSRDDTQGPKELFRVGLASSCLEKVSKERKQFVSAIKEAGDELPEEELYCITEVTVEVTDYAPLQSTQRLDDTLCSKPDGGEHQASAAAPDKSCLTATGVGGGEDETSLVRRERWLVATYHPSKVTISHGLAELCADPELSYRPYVGVAVPLTSLGGFQSQVFCFLPLPLDTRSPTGLPVHVHGFFALSQNRRHLKWPTADQLSHHAHLEPPVRWNCLLVQELLPRVYRAMLDRLRSIHSLNPGEFYSAWPDQSMTDDRWQDCLHPLFTALSSNPCFYSHVQGGQWVHLREAVLEEFSLDLPEGVQRAVVQAYSIGGQRVVRLPKHVYRTMKTLRLLDGAEVVNVDSLCRLLPASLPHLSRQDKLLVLQFICCHDEVFNVLLNQELLPLANGTFCKFDHRGDEASTIYCCSKDLIRLFPGLERRFCETELDAIVLKKLSQLAKSGRFCLRTLEEDDAVIPYLMQQSLELKPIVCQDEAWIECVWTFLAASRPRLDDFKHLTILPSKGVNGLSTLLPLSGVYVSSAVSGMPSLSSHMVSCLTKLKVTVLSDLPKCIFRHERVLNHWVECPSESGVLAALKLISDNTSLCKAAVQQFNMLASADEKDAMLHLLEGLKETPSEMFQHLQLFTEMSTTLPSSVKDVPFIAPESLPSVMLQVPSLLLQSPLLKCSATQRNIAQKLGAKEVNVPELIQRVVRRIKLGDIQVSEAEFFTFIKFILGNEMFTADTVLQKLLCNMKIVSNNSGELKFPRELYNPESALLQEVFSGEDKFPSSDFTDPVALRMLKSLGLREETDILSSDISITAKSIQELFGHQKDKAHCLKKAAGLLTILKDYGQELDSSTLKEISSIQCLPSLREMDRWEYYPHSLPLESSSLLAKPCSMGFLSQAPLVGSVLPILPVDFPPEVAKELNIGSRVDAQCVLNNLDVCLKHFKKTEIVQYRLIFKEMFHFLVDHTDDPLVVSIMKEKECVLTMSADHFARPNSFWIETKSNDILLQPYKYPLPPEFKNDKELFIACGAKEYQSSDLFQSVLHEIETHYNTHTCKESRFDSDFLLVKQILDVLKKETDLCQGTVLLPIHHGVPHVLRFCQARDCTVISKGGLFTADGDEEIKAVHPDVHQETAVALGALRMKERALTDVEDLDYAYEQHQEMSTWIHNLLMDSYVDGFSVPKELIQNADDAGATEVCFLLDEREHTDARQNLISDNMASLQGPALVAYNNKTFSDKDFQNIVRVGAGTKKDDASTIGRFGQGFNSVYNLTEAPSFISRQSMAIFDPQKKYLDKGAGLKLDFRRPKNCDLLSRMPEQFKPYQDVFGCKLKREDNYFNGTLFRFPFRTEEQAAGSLIKNESYSTEKRKEFLKLLLEKAGCLLLFTQNVKTLKVFHLFHDARNPAQPACLLDLKKTTQFRLLTPIGENGNQTVVQCAASQWNAKKDIQIIENNQIEMTVTKEAASTCDVRAHTSNSLWRIAWTSGVDESAKMVGRFSSETLLPLAAVATLIKEDCLQSLRKSPEGFYTSGHLFCFLPLPDVDAHSSYPVHINATFALTSSRRSLLLHSKDDIGNEKAAWNSALFADAIARAYLLLLENVHVEAAKDLDIFYGLWPMSDHPDLLKGFLKCLVTAGNRILPVQGKQWVSLKEAVFLAPSFRNSSCGDIAVTVFRNFWKGNGHLVDTPADCCQSLKILMEDTSYPTKVISEIEFFKEIFFPNIDSIAQNDRDQLVHYALKRKEVELDELLKNFACIPCAGTGMCKHPRELVDPKGAVAKLYLPSDGYFPQDGQTASKQQSSVNFCSGECLESLKRLGMITNKLSWEMVEERANSIKYLFDRDQSASKLRATEIITYLSGVIGTCPTDVKDVLSKTMFLPVLKKPMDWPLPWAAERPSNTGRLAAPCELFATTLQNLVCCHGLIADLDSAFTYQNKDVLKCLGVQTEEDISSQILLQMSKQQLLTLSVEKSKDLSGLDKSIHKLCRTVYSYLNKCIDETEDTRIGIINDLKEKDIIWVGNCFVDPARVALQIDSNLEPYRFELSREMRSYKTFFMAIGVTEKLNIANLSGLLKDLYQQFEGKQLPTDAFTVARNAGQQLAKLVESKIGASPTRPLWFSTFLPDTDCYMRPIDNLCINDCEWLKETETMKFVSREISPQTAQVLGVKSKRRHDLLGLSEAISFRQHEKLTDRINGLLQGYTFDSSLFKELLQNADDAGATEVKFFKDPRSLGKTFVPEGWEELQGPSLCVFNNKSFTKDDMEGIKSLGQGSKRHDLLKIGQYGVGFNAVYHLTDVPSFWTREDDNKEVLCAFDPNCRYIGKSGEPGIKFQDLDSLRDRYEEMLSGYLDNVIDKTKSGTLFRFPLRTQDMANVTLLKEKPVTIADVSQHLDEFKKDMGNCLLFLSNVKKISVYVVKEGGQVELESEVSADLDEDSAERMEHFKQMLTCSSSALQDPTTSPTDVLYAETSVQMTLNLNQTKEKWLIVHRVGLKEKVEVSKQLSELMMKDNFRLLPLGGVAVKLCESKSNESKSNKVFCMLPLPVVTGLPMHVNGQFILDNETRRKLWNNEEGKRDAKTEWNELITYHIIVSAYITALHLVKKSWFATESIGKHTDSLVRLDNYSKLFPVVNLDQGTPPFWTKMTKEVYQQIDRREEALFPVLLPNQHLPEWVPAVKSNGFVGYFDDLKKTYDSALGESVKQSVTLSQGGARLSQISPKDKESLVNSRVSELKAVLRDVNMKILAVPHSIYENFKTSGVDRVRDLSPHNVAVFLKTTSSEEDGCCNLSGLPKPVSSTALKTVENVKALLDFLKFEQNLLCDLQNLPLSLRQSENLYRFCESEEKVVLSKFYSLLPSSADMFINSAIIDVWECSSDIERTFFRRLDIPLLMTLLPDSLPAELCRAGHTCMVKMFPSSDWLKTFWKFVEKNIPPEAASENCLEAKAALGGLQEWKFVPVNQEIDNEKKEQLYPIKDMHKVVYMPKKPEESFRHLWDVLEKQCLPFLNTLLLPPLSIATKLVACIDDPFALLGALNDNAECFHLDTEKASVILGYFWDTVCSNENYKDQCEVVKQRLKHLPLYVCVDGGLIDITSGSEVLCLDTERMCLDGLREWAQNKGIVLLKQNSFPRGMCSFLELKEPTISDFYCQFLLPTLCFLPKRCVYAHIEFIKNNKHFTSHSLKEHLQTVKFVEVNGELYTAGHFFSPHVKVFRAMCEESSFPPDPYCKPEWKCFMNMAGMIHSVTHEMFIRFAHAVEAEGKSGLSSATKRKSHELVRHLLHPEYDIKDDDDFLCQVKNVCFLYPAEWSETEEGKILCKIVEPFVKGRLVSFAQSCLEEERFIVWSSCCILHPATVPNSDRMRKALGILEKKLLKEKAMENLENMCRRLTDQTLKLFESAEVTGTLKTVMMVVYKYLEDSDENDIRRLKNLPIICDFENKQMLKAENVVIELRENETVSGYIHKAPLYFGQVFDFFQRLGVSKTVTVNHYAAVLSTIKKLAGENELHVEELKLVEKAVQGLFRCLEAEGKNTNRVSLDCIFLPSTSKQLIESSQLVIRDHFSFGSRCQDIHEEMSQDIHFFIGFEKLSILSVDPIAKMRLLPKKHLMKLLSDVVKEIIPEEVKARAEQGVYSTDIKQLLRSQEFLNTLVRLAYYYHLNQSDGTPFQESVKEHIHQSLQSICVKEADGLETMLVWAESRRPIHKTLKKKKAFLEKFSESEDKCLCTVYLDRNAYESEGRKCRTIVKSLQLAVLHAVETKLNREYLFLALEKGPKYAEKEMDEEGIPRTGSVTNIEEPIFPPPGTLIPTRFHCYLDNTFSSFYEGEHVGFDVYDPLIEDDDTELNDAVYAYAVIINEIDGNEVSQLTKCYRINLGPDWGIHAVPVTRLYKIFRKVELDHQQVESREMKAYEGPVNHDAAPRQADATTAWDLKLILKNIRQTLREAWQNLDEKDRNRVVKRLYLKWHPDKNMHNQELCTKIVQRLQYYVELLKEGLELPDEDAEEDSGTRKPHTTRRSSFFENMDNRSRAHQDFFRFYAGSRGNKSGNFSSRNHFFEEDYNRSANPQPGEGHRWFRQAEADLNAARKVDGNSGCGHNWTCFQCHQAVEKALKSVLYTRDANSPYLKEHNLTTLAWEVGDTAIQSLACQLENQVGNHMRMRYPDMLCFPKIPGEVYTSEDAHTACKTAAEVLVLVKALLRSQ